MAGNVWSIRIVPGSECASFVPDVYVPPGTTAPTALQAQATDVVSWNNQTTEEHEIWQTGGSQLTNRIPAGQSSSPACPVTGTAPTTMEYYCKLHEGETGTIDVIS